MEDEQEDNEQARPRKPSRSCCREVLARLHRIWLSWGATTTRETGFFHKTGTVEFSPARASTTFATFLSVLVTLFLAVATFKMSCEARRTADAATQANRLVVRQIQSRLDVDLDPFYGKRIAMEGTSPVLETNWWVKDVGSISTKTFASIVKRTANTAPIYRAVRDSLFKALRAGGDPLQHGLPSLEERITWRDTLAPDTSKWTATRAYWHVCIAYRSEGSRRVNYLESVYELTDAPSVESARLVEASAPLRGYFDGNELVVEPDEW